MSSTQLLTLLQHHQPLNKIIPLINGFNYSHSSVVDYILKNYTVKESEYFILELCIHNCMFVKQVMQYLCFNLKQSNHIETILKLIAVCPSSIQFFKMRLYHSMSLDELKSYVDQVIQIESLSTLILSELMTFAVELDHMWQQIECSSSDDEDDMDTVSINHDQSFSHALESPVADKLNYLLTVLLDKIKSNPSELWIQLFKKCVLPTQSHAINSIFVWFIGSTDHKDEFLGMLANEWINGENILVKTRSIWYMAGFLIRVELDREFVKHAYLLMLNYLEGMDKDLIWYATIQSAMYIYCFYYSDLPTEATMRLIVLMKDGTLALTCPLIVEHFCRIVEQEQLWYAKATLTRQRRTVKDAERETVEMLWKWFPLDPVDLPMFSQVKYAYKSFQQ
eukprot:NODE_704_length_4999_cov_0.292653.p2 type:complete len:394 gc:universal NODE_704_length_4999_cov_0.292653:4850-3669(-)